MFQEQSNGTKNDNICEKKCQVILVQKNCRIVDLAILKFEK